MNLRRWALLSVIGLFLAQSNAAAIIDVLTEADVSRALIVAAGSDAARARFHAPYILPVNDPVLEQIEVITEFRRFVMASEEQTALGNWMFARGGYDLKGRTLKDLLRPAAGRLGIRVRLRFHPLNTYAELPPIDVLLGDPSLLPLEVVRTPTLAGDATSGTAIVGAIVETSFNAASVGDGVLSVRVETAGQSLGHANVDFSRLE